MRESMVRSGVVQAVLSVAILTSEGAVLQGGERRKYEDDLSAFFAEMDRSYPFFDLKDIRRGWGSLKESLGKKVKPCASDSDFLEIVLEAIRYLRDGHMGIVKADVSGPSPQPEWHPGISFMPASQERVTVMAAVETMARSLKPGTVVTQIDGKPARKLLDLLAAEAWQKGGPFSSPQRARLLEYRIPLRGKKGEKHKITFLDGKRLRSITVSSDVEAKGWPHTYNMPQGLARSAASCLYGKLASGAGYIHIRRFDEGTEEGIAAALSAHPDADGWIIDLRGNGGGAYGPSLMEKVRGMPRPVAGLIDAGCMSAGETFARDLVQATGARLLGSSTAGASSAKRTWSFPSGIAVISIPTRSRQGIDRPIEFHGIRPHVEVEAEPEEVARGSNSEILRAEALLRSSPRGNVR
jgi:hypothetical protein